MKKYIILTLMLTIATAGCITQEKQGTGFQNPIVIEASHEEEGIAKEYDWLTKNACTNNEGIADLESQELQENNGHWFDIMTMTCNNGQKETYYFQIDSFFGKWE